MSLVKEAYKNLLDFKILLETLEIPFWLDGGTLLGFYRDKTFCKDDENDIDLCTWINYYDLKDKIITGAERIGFKIYHIWPTELSFVRDDVKIDLFFNFIKGRFAYTYLYKGDKKVSTVQVPSHFYHNLDKLNVDVNIDNIFTVFNIPSETNNYLTLKYGDWQIPIHRKEYANNGGCYKQDNNKIVKEEVLHEDWFNLISGR